MTSEINIPTNIYFLGIGGIGMSGLARFFLERGHRVAGFDRNKSELTNSLEQEGAAIIYEDKIEWFPKDWKPNNCLIVRTPAVKNDNQILRHLSENRYPMLKRAEILGLITKNMRCLAVAGTHGKTTTSSILTHLCHQGGHKAYGFLGGLAGNFQSNYVSGEIETVVVEADEYDRSFLHLRPNIALITNTDSDHLDIYESAENLLKTFDEFAGIAREKGIVIKRIGLDVQADFTYGLDEKADFHATNIRTENGGYHFELVTPKSERQKMYFPLAGRHNLENAVGAAAAAIMDGVSIDQIAAGMQGFKGVKRRFEKHMENPVLIDDYAHHPTELEALINTIEEMWPESNYTLIFQPHLYSRTQDFLKEFAATLDKVPYPILLPVYPARELPEHGVDSEEILRLMKNKNARCIQKQELVNLIEETKPKVTVIAGAGDIELLIPQVKNCLIKLNNQKSPYV